MDIVEEIRQDREKGAKRLESEYKAGLMALACRFCADPSDAEELVNATFATVVENIDDYLEQSAFFGWMCQILMSHHSRNVRRKSNQNIVYPGVVPDIADENAHEAIYDNLDATLLRKAIDELPKEQRDAIALHYFMDMSVAQIAKFLAVPTGTVMSRLHYARRALAAKLGSAARKPGVKALLFALALAALTAVGAAVASAVGWGEHSVRAEAPQDGDSLPQTSAAIETADEPSTPGQDGSLGESAPSVSCQSLAGTAPAVPASITSTITQPTQATTTMNSRSNLGILLATGLSLGAQGTIVDDDTLVFTPFDASPANRLEVNALRVAGDTSKPAFTLWCGAPNPTKTSDEALPVLFAGYSGLAEKTVNTNVLCLAGGYTVLQMTDCSYLNDDFTFEFFYRTESDSFADHFDGDKTVAYLAIQHNNWHFRLNKSNGTVTCYGGKEETTPAVSCADGKWHHFAVVWRKIPAKTQIYIDHSLVSEQDLSTTEDGPLPRGSTLEEGRTLLVGRGPWDNNYRWVKKGRYDGIRLTRRALAPMEFLSPRIYPVDADTLAYMSFDSYAAAQSGQYDVLLNANALSCARRTLATTYGTNETVFAASLYHAAQAKDSFTDSRSLSTAITGSGNNEAGFGYVFADPDHLVGTTDFTAEVFARFTAAPSPNYGYVFYQPNVWSLFLMGNGHLGCLVAEESHLGTVSLVDNNWHHLAAVYDSARRTFSYYLDYALFWRFENVANPLADGASNPEKLLFGGRSHDAYNMRGSVNGALYDELRITGRALKVSEFLTDVTLLGADPVFHARFESSWAVDAPTGRYAPAVSASANGASLARGARVSQEILDSNKQPLFADTAGLALAGGAVSYPLGGVLDLDAATAECFVRRTGGGAGDVLVAFAQDCDVSSPIWRLAANGMVSVATDSDSDTLAVDLSDGAWHHFALSWSQGPTTTDVQVWRDHVPVGSMTLDGIFDFGSGAGFILGSAGASGAIDELRLREGVLGTDGMLHAAPPPATVLYVR